MAKDTKKEKLKEEDAPKKEEEEEKKCNKAEGMDMDEEEEESEEEKKKKKKATKKGEEGGENPEEAGASSADANSSTSPNMGVPSTQNVFVPQSNIAGTRNASSGSMGGQSPSEVSYTGKSAKPDLMKSPLFVEISGQLSELQKSMDRKMDAVEKSMSDRIANINKAMEKIEKFYSQPFYKAASENNNPEAIIQQGISKQIADGQVRFRN